MLRATTEQVGRRRRRGRWSRSTASTESRSQRWPQVSRSRWSGPRRQAHPLRCAPTTAPTAPSRLPSSRGRSSRTTGPTAPSRPPSRFRSTTRTSGPEPTCPTRRCARTTAPTDAARRYLRRRRGHGREQARRAAGRQLRADPGRQHAAQARLGRRRHRRRRSVRPLRPRRRPDGRRSPLPTACGLVEAGHVERGIRRLRRALLPPRPRASRRRPVERAAPRGPRLRNDFRTSGEQMRLGRGLPSAVAAGPARNLPNTCHRRGTL
jgi:hypothetical protein